MAMTTCRECQAHISDKAEACPKCGAPQRGTVTIQATAKRYKGWQAAGVVAIVVGLVGLLREGGSEWGALVAFAGLCAYLWARVGAWWRHG